MKSLRELTTATLNVAWSIFICLFYIAFGVDCAPAARPKNGSSTVVPTTMSKTTVNITTVEAISPMKPTFRGIGLRAIYVITVVSGIVVMYFVVRAICSRRRKNRTRRYGILNTEGRDNMEMRPLSEQDDDDDDEDMTLFDMSKRKGKR